MLVLAVPEGDYVEVNGPCRIYVIRNGLTPRLGFEANKDTDIKRAKFCGPIADRIRQQVGEGK